MSVMRLCIVTFSKSGAKIARQLKRDIPEADVYLKEGLATKDEQMVKSPFREFVGEIFRIYDGLIFIMATGIVVREIAPYLNNKKVDPALVVVDDLGQFAISLLSGHLGGANELARRLARILGATPVITTSTDLHQVPAFDLLAKRWGMTMERSAQLKYISGALIDGGNIGVFTDMALPGLQGEQVQVAGNAADLLHWDNDELTMCSRDWNGIVLVTDLVIPDVAIAKMRCPVIILRPRTLVAGMGFRRGKNAQELRSALEQACALAGVAVNSLAKVVTIDVKADEPGIIQLCAELEIPLQICSTGAIQQVENLFPASGFVRQAVGVGAVAEPCAYLGTTKGEWVLHKERLDGVTVAIMRERQTDAFKRNVVEGGAD